MLHLLLHLLLHLKLLLLHLHLHICLSLGHQRLRLGLVARCPELDLSLNIGPSDLHHPLDLQVSL